MPTASRTWTWPSSLDGWVDISTGINGIFSLQAGDGNPADCVEFFTSGAGDEAGARSGPTTDTWETLNAALIGQTISQVQLAGFDNKFSANTYATLTVAIDILDATGVSVLAGGPLYSNAFGAGATGWGSLSGNTRSVISGKQLSTTPVQVVVTTTGGSGPHTATWLLDNLALLATYLAADNPPFTLRPRTPAFFAYPVPPPDPFLGGFAPLRPRQLAPSILAIPQNNPPFSHPGRWAVTGQILRASDPPPPNAFEGGRQPAAPRSLPPSIIAVREDNPPFSHRGRIGQTISIVLASQPPPPNPWMGGFEALAPRLLPAGVLGVRQDNPPFSHPGRSVTAASTLMLWQPPPPDPFIGYNQPLRPRILPASLLAVREDPPPPTTTAKLDKMARILQASQPPPPDPFFGGHQPLAWVTLNSAVHKILQLSQCRDNAGALWTPENPIDDGVDLASCGCAHLGNGYGVLYGKAGKILWLTSTDGLTWDATQAVDTGLGPGRVYGIVRTPAGVIVALIDSTVKISRDRGLSWHAGGAIALTGNPAEITAVGDLIVIIQPDGTSASPTHFVSKDHGAHWL